MTTSSGPFKQQSAPFASWNNNQAVQATGPNSKADNPEISGHHHQPAKDRKPVTQPRKGLAQGQIQQQSDTERQSSELDKPSDPDRAADPKFAIGTPFVEKHLVESLDVESADPMKSVLFYNMLNQGLKRGK